MLYLYVGCQGKNPRTNDSGKTYVAAEGGWNGGCAGDYDHCDDECAGGGAGATDIRLVNGNWDIFSSLKSRIMVAGAGGGGGGWGHTSTSTPIGGSGGGLTGVESFQMVSTEYTVIQGSQTSGYKFGIGEDGISIYKNQNCGGGGSGYYGGCAYNKEKFDSKTDDYSGGGGSSFISGHTGCNAISSSSTENNIIHTGQPNHYSGYVFTNTVMKAGNESMPSPTGGTETGHTGNGYCKITWHPTL